MTSREKKSAGDFVLESRHLVGLFILLVVIFGIVFTLGYLLGRGQYDVAVRAATGTPGDGDTPPSETIPKSKGNPDRKLKARAESGDDAVPGQNQSDWDFYHSAEPKKTEDHLQAPKKIIAEAKPPAASAHETVVPAKVAKPSSSAVADASLIPKGTIMLQVAAVTSQGDALALAQALQQKKFPAFVITPSGDKYYRVQVGPYKNDQAATTARNNLEAQGFKSITKR